MIAKITAKKVKTIIILIFILGLFVSLAGGCEEKVREYGNFTYILSKNKVQIVGFTDEGKKQKYIILPEYIDGKEVVGFYLGKPSFNDFGSGYKVFNSDALEKMYMFHTYGSMYFQCPKMDTLIVINVELNDDGLAPYLHNFGEDDNKFCYINPAVYFSEPEWFEGIKPANIVFDYNYEDSPNHGAYWLDNINYGGMIDLVPDNPVREGYIFYGWYKEAECVNLWVFESDKLPDAVMDNENKETYQKTTLYAKWIEKELWRE